MRALPTLPRTAGSVEVSAAIDEVGAVIVDGLVDPALLGRLRHDLAPWVQRTPAGSRSGDPEWEQFHGRNTVRVNGIAAKTSTFVDVCLDDTILGVADHRLIPDGGSTQINDTQLIAIGPGEPAQYLHRDQTGWPWFNDYLPDGPEITVIAMLALTDCTAANGATRIVPGSHLRPDSNDLFDPAASIPAEMSAGSVLLFSGKTIHGGGANHTADQWRHALHISYLLGWLRTEEAHAFSVPAVVAATLPRRAQELLGFAEYNPAPHGGGRLWLVDFEDPAHLFERPDDNVRLGPAHPDPVNPGPVDPDPANPLIPAGVVSAERTPS
jgi:ectoine hydroxylase-related dioxygenase (phytanoyl-CoA dioxygenase family)